MFIFIASAAVASAQSNMNCDMYLTSSPPASDYVDIFRSWGNDSHAQLSTLSDYPFTFGCNSTVATLDYGCTGTYVDVVQLFRQNDSHVSVDGFYPEQACFNTSTASRSFYYNISATGATPAGYECAFSIAKMNDSHVYECDHLNATYNVNLKINSSQPPYSGCVNLSNESTYQGKVVSNASGFFINEDVELCRDVYRYNDSGMPGVVITNASGVTVDCNGSTLVGNSSGIGFRSGHPGVTMTGCNASNYSTNYRFWSGSSTELVDSESWYGYHSVYFSSDNNNLSGFSSYYSGSQALYLSGNSGNNITDSALYYGSGTGVYLLSGADGNFFMNLSVLNHTASVYIYNSDSNTFRNCTLYGNSSLHTGIGLKGTSSNNLFYYNSISGTYSLFAASERADNHFNTTNGSGCGPNCSRGNYWGDILSRDIVDLNGDGFGDSGAEYPYNSTNGGSVSINVTDWGPITTKGCVDNDGDGFYIQSAPPSCPGTFRDCDDNNASIVPPKDDLSINADTWLCNGTYYINDSGLSGVVRVESSNVDLTCLGTTIIGNSSGEGIYIFSSSTGVNGCNVSNYSVSYMVLPDDNHLDNISSWYSGVAVNLDSADGNNVSRLSSYHENFAMTGSNSDDNNVTDCQFYDDAVGVRLSGGSDRNFFMNLSMAAGGGFEVFDSFNNTLRNSTLQGNVATSDGIYLVGTSSNNLFYYNSISGTYRSYANVSRSGNHFNTTVAGAAHGNYWDDILTLDIIDTDDDGFGDYGTEYPYNSTNGANVNVNVTDWGPITSKVCYDADGDGAYNTSSDAGCSGFRDCDDDNASLFPPKDDLSITADTWLCDGTYYINDSGSSGVVSFGADSVSLECLGTTIVGNGSGTGFRTADSGTAISGCNASGYSANYFIGGSSNRLVNSSSWNASGFAVQLSSQDTNVTGLSSDYDSYGLYMNDADGNNITSSAFRHTTQEGAFLFNGADNNFFMDVVFADSVGGTDVYVQDSLGNTVRNSSFSGSTSSAIDLAGSSSGNLVYFNSFSGSYTLFAVSDRADNHFNTTAPACAVNCSRGNYWGDILSLDIYDGSADGFGDGGPEYPYNSTNGGSVNINVTDWGPITTKTYSDSEPPNGTIIVYGPNGTVTTGTRNVFLNLTYDDNQQVDKCRWANDGPANLTSMPWEECTTVKAWILSEGEGNKTVYYQVRDVAGNNATFNDSILYSYTQDYSPPGAPVIYDGPSGSDLDWWDDNSTLHAHWDASADDISTVYYKYRVINQTGCLDPSCAWTDAGTATEATAAGLNLYEGANYSFEVLAYVSPAINSSSVSDGVVIDLTRPDAPAINSSTHPVQSEYYGSATAEFNFSASDPVSNGVASGIDGYSYLLDRLPGTAPDDVVEDRQWQTVAGMREGSCNQTLKANGTGSAFAVYRQIISNFTEDDSVRVTVALAEMISGYDDLMGVNVSLIRVAQGAAIDDFDEPDRVADVQSSYLDIAYASGMSLAEKYLFDLAVNQTVDDTVSDVYVRVAGVPSDDDNRNSLSIACTASGLDTSYARFVCDESGSCTDTNSTADYAVEVKKADSGDWEALYSGLADGTYYFHVKAQDIAGNWGDTGHYQVNVAAGGVSVSIASPVDGQVFPSEGTEANISVKVLVSGNASVEVIALHPDGSNFTASPEVFGSANVFRDVVLESGQNEIYAVATTGAGAVTRSSSVYVIVRPSLLPTTNRTLRVTYSGGGAYVGSHLTHADEGGAYVGVGTENPGSVLGGGDVLADTEVKSIKIFATRPFTESGVEDDLEDDDFLDQKAPSFGFSDEVREFLIRNELRYEDVFLGGEPVVLSPGKYSVYLNHWGVTEDGRVNLTVSVE